MGARDLLHDLLDAGFALEVDGGKLLVTPASALTDDMRDKLRAGKAELMAMLARQAPVQRPPGFPRRCADCQHLTRVNTCSEPVGAGMLTEAEGYGIVWPPAAHAVGCMAFISKAPAKSTQRTYGLLPAQGIAAHAEALDDAALARFRFRLQRLVWLGADSDNIDDVVERLRPRDAEADDRVTCLECSHFRPGRCGSSVAAGLSAPELARDMAVTLQRCVGFALHAQSR